MVNLPPQNSYQDAYNLAREALRSADIQERSEKSGATFEAGKNGNRFISLTFLNRSFQIGFPDIKVGYGSTGEEVPLWSKILILHYLVRSQGRPLTGEWINFRQVPGGATYYPAFVKRSQEPLLNFFCNQLDLLDEAARKLGGGKVNYGDRAVVIPAFPRVPIMLVFWVGDEELHAEANILFDATVSSYLSTEDIAVLSQQVVFTMIRWAKHKGAG